MEIIINLIKSNPIYSAALALFCLLVWAYAIYIYIKAQAVEKSYYDKTIVPQYEPPANISPILGYYLLSFGSQGKTIGDLSRSGEQCMVLIHLYEKGLLNKLIFSGSEPMKAEYTVNESYASLAIKPEEKMFLDALVKASGMQGTLIEEMRQRNNGRYIRRYPDGFEKINTFWFTYWHKNLSTITNDLKITNIKNTTELFLQIFASTLTFGGFFAIFLFLFSEKFHPLAYLGFLLILPQVILYFVGVLLLKLLAAVNLGFIISGLDFVEAKVMLFITLFSWFFWFMIFASSVKKLYFRFTENGKTILQNLAGYKMYLKTVDLDRVSLTKKDLNSKINSTTFPWLLAFEIADYNQWAQWHSLTEGKNNTDTNPAVVHPSELK
jgi:hypothetical protein